MERDTFFHTAALPAIDPPSSREVLRHLASYLTPPHKERSLPAPEAALDWAYQACAQIIRQHSKSFYFSARLLPPGKREAVMSLYAFCRTSDDLVDKAALQTDRPLARERAAEELARWAQANRGSHEESTHPVVHAWGHTRRHYSIPDALPEELLSGIRMDLTFDRYQTWDELWLYCYRVASTVGLMSMYITGADNLSAVPYAVQLGVALQLTNILRDVGEDARAGRVYLPTEDMARFGYSEEELMQGIVNPNFIRLMDFQIARATALYDASWRGIALLPRDSRLAVGAAATVYKGILKEITAGGYDVFRHRAHLTLGQKLRALPAVWWQTSRMQAVS